MKPVPVFLALGLNAFAAADPLNMISLANSIIDNVNGIIPTDAPISIPTLTVPLTSTTSSSVLTIATGGSSYGLFTTAKVPLLNPALPTATPNPGDSTSFQVMALPQEPHGPLHRGNWASGFDINTDYSQQWPITGRVVSYTLRIQNRTLAPDGVPKQMLVVNGQYPGPKIEANWGDVLSITVINELTANGTGIHWHGLRQLNTALSDGVNGVTECPIAPGDSKVYRFRATQYGSSWYHAHYSVQYGDGVLGPLVIHGPASANYDIDLGHVLLTDYYKGTVYQEDAFARRHGPPIAQNYLMNGQNIRLDGKSGTRPKWNFEPGKKHRIRLVNTGLDVLFKVQIDGHRMQVIAADFVPINPYYTLELSIAAGQRYDVIVQADQQPKNYWFRAMSANDCSFIQNKGTGNANGIITYSNSPNPAALPTTSSWPHSDACVDEPITKLVPIVTQDVDDSTFKAVARPIGVNLAQLQDNAGVFYQWTIGGIAQKIDWSNPTILQAASKNNNYSKEKNVITLDKPNAWVFWVIQNQFFVPHPMHLHGHDFTLIGQGNGVFDPRVDYGKLNFKNPPRRDVALLVAKGWTAIAFKTDNPGPWLMHCHIAWHAGEGLSLQFLERPADIPRWYGYGVSSAAWQGTCNKWRTFQKNMPWKQYDSGLRKRILDDGSAFYELEELPPRKLGRRLDRSEGAERRARQYVRD